MQLYELTYLASPDLTPDQIKALQEKIISFLENEGGVLTENSEATKKVLAYPIKKRKEAYLTSLYFHLSQEKILELEKNLKKEPEILRYLILIKKLPKKVTKSRELKRKISPKPLKPKAEFKEIEKKLEEILTQN